MPADHLVFSESPFKWSASAVERALSGSRKMDVLAARLPAYLSTSPTLEN
jgi:hypothetical protein